MRRSPFHPQSHRTSATGPVIRAGGWPIRAVLVVLAAVTALAVVQVARSQATPAGGPPDERSSTENPSDADGAQRAGTDSPRWANYSGDVTIVAKYPTTVAGIDALEFVVTRASATTRDRPVRVKLSSGIPAAARAQAHRCDSRLQDVGGAQGEDR